MSPGQPSRTMLRTATLTAAHQLLDKPLILERSTPVRDRWDGSRHLRMAPAQSCLKHENIRGRSRRDFVIRNPRPALYYESVSANQPPSMDITIRRATEFDAENCGRIGYEGFRAINERHGLALNFPSAEAASQRLLVAIRNPLVFGAVAETSGRILAFVFSSERDPICAVGPIVTAAAFQGQGVGRQLLNALRPRTRCTRCLPASECVQCAFPLPLCGAWVRMLREHFVVMAGSPQSAPSSEWEIRHLMELDVPQCEKLHQRVHGYSRTNELRDAILMATPIVALRGGLVRAYMAAPTNWLANHGVSETEEDMQALFLGAAKVVQGALSCLIPVRRATLFRWCLQQRLRSINLMTLMTIGEYQEPQGSYFPSILY